MSGRTVLISGASVAGPVLAYWLRRHGMAPTVIERTPRPRLGTGGHAVDLFGAAVEVVDRMGLLPAIQEARTRTTTLRVMRGDRPQTDISIEALVAGVSDSRHVEILRGELARLLREAVTDDVEHLFGDEITALHDDGDGVDVTFARAAPRRFDLVVGADGLHSGVRRLAFGPESEVSHHLGGYLAAFSYADQDLQPGVMQAYNDTGRTVATYPVRQTGQARAVFLFRGDEGLVPDHRDTAAQRALLQRVFGSWTQGVSRLVEQAQSAEDFYLDSITQIRMDTWSRGRVTLVGDAGYSPGPAIGGGTTLAPIGAYTLAHHLARTGEGRHDEAFRAYEADMRELVLAGRALGPTMMRGMVPTSRLQARVTGPALRVLLALPQPLRRRVLAGANRPFTMLGDTSLPGPAGGE